MIRNLKVLGLALAAMLALSAVAASGAFAEDPQGELTSDGPVTLDMTEFEGENALTMFGDRIECPGSTYTGHAVKTHEQTTHTEETSLPKHELIEVPATTATITPHYNQPACNSSGASGNHKTTITMNGCDYVYHLGDTVGADEYALTTDIVCPPEQHIILHIYFATSNENIKACDITIGAQSGIAGPTVRTDTTAEPHDLIIEGSFTGIAMTKTGLCGHAATNEAVCDVKLTVEGTNEDQAPTGITVSDTRN